MGRPPAYGTRMPPCMWATLPRSGQPGNLRVAAQETHIESRQTAIAAAPDHAFYGDVEGFVQILQRDFPSATTIFKCPFTRCCAICLSPLCLCSSCAGLTVSRGEERCNWGKRFFGNLRCGA